MDPRQPHHVFVSYSSRDRVAAEVIRDGLERRGLHCWIAPRDVRPGADWSEEILGAIENAGLMLLVVSSNANASNQIKREVERAVNRGVPILPLRIEDVLPARSLEYFISTSHWMDAIEPPLAEHCERLATAIRSLLGTRVAMPAIGQPPAAAEPARPAARTLARIRIPAHWKRPAWPGWMNGRRLAAFARAPLAHASPRVAIVVLVLVALAAVTWILRRPGGAPTATSKAAGASGAQPSRQPARYSCKKGFQFDVSPDDAVVTVDGKSIGTAEDWSEGPYAMASPGRHTVRLARKDHRSSTFDVEIGPDGRFNYCLIRIELVEID